jgi:hypothetical protein
MRNENEIYCSNCGTLIPSSAKFCTSCGLEQIEIEGNHIPYIESNSDIYSDPIENFKSKIQENKKHILYLIVSIIAYFFLNRLIPVVLVEINSELNIYYFESKLCYSITHIIPILMILKSIKLLENRDHPSDNKPYLLIGLGLLLYKVFWVFFTEEFYQELAFNKVLEPLKQIINLLALVSLGWGIYTLEFIKNYFNVSSKSGNKMSILFAIIALFSVFLPWASVKTKSYASGYGSNFNMGSSVDGITGVTLGYGIVGIILGIIVIYLSLQRPKFVYIIGSIMTFDSLTYLLTLGTSDYKGSYSGGGVSGTAEINVIPQFGLILFIFCSIAIVYYSYKDRNLE